MATTDLGKWMITNGGEYNPDTTYEQLTMVLYQNSTYITLRTVTGIIPNNDKINYILMAQGFSANALADVVAKDTYGVIGDVSGDVSAQNLVDYLFQPFKQIRITLFRHPRWPMQCSKKSQKTKRILLLQIAI